MFNSLSKQVLVTFSAIGSLATLLFIWFLSSSINSNMIADTQSKATELLSRTAQMFLVSTIKFEEQFSTETDPARKAEIHQDWIRTIRAVDTAVINDFGDNQSRVRLFTDSRYVKPPSMGGSATAAEGQYELNALKAFNRGESAHTSTTEDFYRLAVPLYSNMHPGCANCHGLDPSDRILLGGVSVNVPLTEANATVNERVLISTSVMLAIMLAFLATIYFFVINKVIRPIKSLNNQTTEITRAIESGNLDKDLHVNAEHEIQDMANSFTELLKVIRALFSNMNNNSKRVLKAAENTSSMAKEHQDVAVKQQSNINNIVVALEELLQVGSLVSERAGKTAETSSQVNTYVKEGRDTMENALSAINNLSQEVNKASEVIQTLDQRSDSIGSIISTIDGIAEQTNLLALNAAIEAARAGEQGRGFAVVADEVRTLAQRTQEATSEINELIKNLQSDARTASNVMQTGTKTADDTVTYAQKAQDKLDEITNQVATINDMNRDIASASDQQMSTVANINHLLQDVSQETDNSVEAAISMASESKQLEQLSQHMTDMKRIN